ncbi:1685_t:CDS:2, partial [Cetraspora pellucida]
NASEASESESEKDNRELTGLREVEPKRLYISRKETRKEGSWEISTSAKKIIKSCRLDAFLSRRTTEKNNKEFESYQKGFLSAERLLLAALALLDAVQESGVPEHFINSELRSKLVSRIEDSIYLLQHKAEVSGFIEGKTWQNQQIGTKNSSKLASQLMTKKTLAGYLGLKLEKSFVRKLNSQKTIVDWQKEEAEGHIIGSPRPRAHIMEQLEDSVNSEAQEVSQTTTLQDLYRTERNEEERDPENSTRSKAFRILKKLAKVNKGSMGNKYNKREFGSGPKTPSKQGSLQKKREKGR